MLMMTDNASKRTPLITAAYKGNDKVIKALLEPPPIKKGSLINLLGDEHAVRRFFETSGGLRWHPLMSGMLGKEYTVIDVREQDGMIALPSADGSSGGRWHFTEEMVTLIQPPDAATKRQDLLHYGAEYGMTALHYAVHEGHVHCTRELLDHADDPDATILAPEEDGWNSLHYASYHGHVVVIKALVRKSSKPQENILAKDPHNGESSLHRAAGQGKDLAVRAILESKNVDKEALLLAQDKKGLTPLHHAAMEGHRKVAKIIKELAPNLNLVLEIKDKEGKSPLEYAEVDVRSLLTDHEAEL